MTKKVFSKYFIYCAAGIIAALILSGPGWLLLRKYSFANPTLLWLALPVAILCIIAALLKHIFKPSLKFPLPAVLKEDNQKKEKNIFALLANWTAFSLCALALFLCAVALARPRSEGKTIIPPTKGIDIMLTIDTSQSMLALDFQPDRITAAKTTAEDFVKKRATDRIGVVVFDDLSMLQCPLTLDYFAVFDYIKTINIGITGGKGGTAIGDAVALSVEHLKNSAARSKVLILLTDGENNSGTVDPVAAAKAAQTYGIKIYTIAVSADGNIRQPVKSVFGTQYASMSPISSQGEALLMEMAKLTDGKFYRARGNLDLQNIYSEIDSLEKTEFEQSAQINYKDEYVQFLAFALILLLFAFVADKFIFVKIP